MKVLQTFWWVQLRHCFTPLSRGLRVCAEKTRWGVNYLNDLHNFIEMITRFLYSQSADNNSKAQRTEVDLHDEQNVSVSMDLDSEPKFSVSFWVFSAEYRPRPFVTCLLRRPNSAPWMKQTAHQIPCFSVVVNVVCIFRERGREGEREERNTDVREKHPLVASRTRPGWRPNLQSRHVPWQGIKPGAFRFADYTSQGQTFWLSWF